MTEDKKFWECDSRKKGCVVTARTPKDAMRTGYIFPSRGPEAHKHLSRHVEHEVEKRVGSTRTRFASVSLRKLLEYFRHSINQRGTPKPGCEQFKSGYEFPLAKRPKYPWGLWNVRGWVEEALPRSQASMEATHLAFQKKNKRRPRMFDFLTALHKFDTQKMQEAREALTKKLPRRRPEFAEMDRQLLNLVKNARLGTDQEIGAFLEVSLSLQRLEPNFLDFPLAEEVENDPPTDDQNENEAVNFPGDSAFIDHDYWPSFLEDQNI